MYDERYMQSFDLPRAGEIPNVARVIWETILGAHHFSAIAVDGSVKVNRR